MRIVYYGNSDVTDVFTWIPKENEHGTGEITWASVSARTRRI